MHRRPGRLTRQDRTEERPAGRSDPPVEVSDQSLRDMPSTVWRGAEKEEGRRPVGLFWANMLTTWIPPKKTVFSPLLFPLSMMGSTLSLRIPSLDFPRSAFLFTITPAQHITWVEQVRNPISQLVRSHHVPL